MSAASAPVTVQMTRLVRRGQAAEYERLMDGMFAAAARFPGHMGGFSISPDVADGASYRTLFAFDTDEHLQAWMGSAEREQWLQRITPLTHGGSAMRVLTGLETWFALPAAQTKEPPPRWKMAMVTWLGIFPLVLLFSNLVGPLLGPFLHPALGVAVVTLLTVGAMTWLVAPTLTRLFAGWLYPKLDDPASAEANSPTPSTENR